jgi:hypothetical protein
MDRVAVFIPILLYPAYLLMLDKQPTFNRIQPRFPAILRDFSKLEIWWKHFVVYNKASHSVTSVMLVLPQALTLSFDA